jgi:hypothetical protein
MFISPSSKNNEKLKTGEFIPQTPFYMDAQAERIANEMESSGEQNYGKFSWAKLWKVQVNKIMESSGEHNNGKFR